MSNATSSLPEETKALIFQARQLKNSIDSLRAQYKEVQERIFDAIPIPTGKKTNTVQLDEQGGIRVYKKEDYSWNQDLLKTARKALGEEIFWDLFSYKIEHKSKTKLDEWLETAPKEIKKHITAALTVKTYNTVSFVAPSKK